MTTMPFELEQLGLDIRIVPTLNDPSGLGVWISELSPEVQAQILIGWLVETEPAPADVLMATRRIALELRDRNIDPGWITPALEDLLRALRTTTIEGDTDAQPE